MGGASARTRGLALLLALSAAHCTLFVSTESLMDGPGGPGGDAATDAAARGEASADGSLEDRTGGDDASDANRGGDDASDANRGDGAVATDGPPEASTPTDFGLGDGHDGAYSVPGAGVMVNRYTAVVADAPAGATQVSVASTTAFTAGTLVMLVQVGGYAPAPPSGTAAAIALDASTDAGRFTLARITSVVPGALNLASPLPRAHAKSVTQVVSVPEYTSLTIPAGASIVARPWDGSTGGIVALLATGTVSNGGEINVSGQGFRGGPFMTASSNGSCSALDVAPPVGGQKGEGIATTSYGSGFGGYGNAANGAGGGNCERGGGGGGGHAAPGGKGGLAPPSSDVGGRGGVKITYDGLTRITFGGGGGAAHARIVLGTSGAAGGGAVFLRAGKLDGAGWIRANGMSAAQASGNSGGDSGAGGGGAGGLVHLRVTGSARCGGLEANGGNGGGSNGQYNGSGGPGGGGGGGRMVLQAGSFDGCGASVLGGVAGLSGYGSNGPYGGALPSSNTDLLGVLDVLAGGYVP